MARSIDADKLLEIYKKWVPQLSSKEDEGDRRGVETCIAVLEDMPTMDAVEVVRCRDCKHYKPQKKSAHWEHRANYCNRVVTIKTQPDDFCSHGERKEVSEDV